MNYEKELIGDVCACVPDTTRNGKTRYYRVGAAFRSLESGGTADRISIKIDTLPIGQANWNGWLNIFPRRANSADDQF